MKTRLPAFFVVMLLGTAGLTAWASSIPRYQVNVTTVQRYCTRTPGTDVGIQCNANVNVLTGKLLTDGGTRATSDAGTPITPVASSEIVVFPANVHAMNLGGSGTNFEQCVGVIAVTGNDAGTLCTFFDVFGVR